LGQKIIEGNSKLILTALDILRSLIVEKKHFSREFGAESGERVLVWLIVFVKI